MPRPDRLHVSPADRQHIEAEILIGLLPGPLESGFVLFQNPGTNHELTVLIALSLAD